MSVMNNLTIEQLDVLSNCTTKEELIAKANELGIQYTDADVEEAMVLLSKESGEVDDDALDAVAGGADYKNGYKKVKKNNLCELSPNRWEQSTAPSYPNIAAGRCGSCEHGRKYKTYCICALQIEGK